MEKHIVVTLNYSRNFKLNVKLNSCIICDVKSHSVWQRKLKNDEASMKNKEKLFSSKIGFT